MLLKKLRAMNNVKLDFFHVEKAPSSNTDIFIDKKYKPVLNNYSLFLASFDDANAIAKGVSDVALGYNFSVYRASNDTNQLMYVSHLEDGELTVEDFNVVNNTNYKYYIFKEDSNYVSEVAISNEVETCWWDWSIVDLIQNVDEDNYYYADLNNMWKFSLNLSSETISQNMNTTTYNNLTRYPKVSVGKSNYSSGALTCLLGEIQKTSNGNIEYVEKSTRRNEWNEFCTNGHIKLLKDRKGNSMLVSITSTSSNTNDILREQADTITFNWVEVGSPKKVTIIGG